MDKKTEEVKKPSLLGGIVKANKDFKPQKIIIYAVPGIGKTTFASTFKDPILIRTEDGAGNIDIDTFPTMPKNYTALIDMLKVLYSEEHSYKTLVIDSLDWCEPIVWAETCRIHGEQSIESFGYGKGYTHADELWRKLTNALDHIGTKKNMDIVLISHSEIKRYEAPDSDPYDRYQIKLHKKASRLWREWADIVLFCNYKIQLIRTDSGFSKEKSRGVGHGERVIYTEERPAFRAKNRWGLPPEIYIGQDKTWQGFHDALTKATNGKY
ncbi:MAG: ATP-binding protein, partial [Bacteroidetes bacterium]|nr:ATP-binding protein [Bacteroidota bacterium]